MFKAELNEQELAALTDIKAEDLRSYYVEKEPGVYAFAITEGEGDDARTLKLENVDGLKSVAKRERELTREKGREVAELRRQLDEALAKAGSVDPALPDQFAKMQSDYDAMKASNGEIMAELERAKVESSIERATRENRGTLGFSEFLSRRTRYNSDTKRIEAYDIETGAAILDDSGAPMDVSSYARELAAQAQAGQNDAIASVLYGTGSSGGGSTPGGGRKGAQSKTVITANTRRSELSPRARVELIREIGDAAYQQLPY